MIAFLIVIVSCTKMEIVSGRYAGLASGYYVGTNVNATIDIIPSDTNKVDLICDFEGYQYSFHKANLFQGDDGFFITETSGVKASLVNGDLNFQYVNKKYPLKNVIFRGTK